MSRGKPTVRWEGLRAGIVALASIVVACGGSQPQGQSKEGIGDAASTMVLGAGEAAESVVSAVGESLGITLPKPSPESSVKAVEEPPARLPRSTPAPPAPVAVEPVEVVIEPPAAELVDAVTEPYAAEPAIAGIDTVPEVVEAPMVSGFEDFALYSVADADVVPPVPPEGSPLRPWLASPSEPGLLVEVTVAHDGTAEKVRMRGVVRLSDASILSQVKAWRFTPALRAGKPVRYRVLLHDPVLAP